MSCVIGYADNEKIYIGGDSACVNIETFDIRTRRDPKVFIKDNFIFGYVGSYRVGQVLRYSFVIPPKPKGGMKDFDYLCSIFVPSLIASLKENDCFQYKNEGEFVFDGKIMVGFDKNIYVISSDLQVTCELGTYFTIGSGESYAIGALHTMEKMNIDLPPEKKIEFALETAEYYNSSVRRPFIVCSM